MPDIPDGATTPTDRRPSIAPVKHAEGWDLLRPPMDVELWEATDFLAAAAKVKIRGDQITITTSTMTIVGELARQLQTVMAVNSAEFRTWAKSGDLVAQIQRIVPLAMEYAAALGEADSSET